MPRVYAILFSRRLLLALKLVLSALGCFGFLLLCFEAAAYVMLPTLAEGSRAEAVGGERILFVSAGAFVNRNGYFNFSPNREIREVAYFPDGDGFSLEADCTFRSDRRGFLSNAVSYEESEILLLGDSFAQGSGGCAWLPRLAPEMRQKLYSAAVLGTGVKHWRNILADLETLTRPKKILVIFITHDFFRSDWVFDQSQLECLSRRAACDGQFWYPLSDDMDQAAARRYALRKSGIGKFGFSKAWRYYFPASSALLTALTSRTLQESLAIVADLARAYPLKLIWVNQKSEVDGPEARTIFLWERLGRFDLAKCHIPTEGFLERDGHPNSHGYEVLKGCVERAVDGW
jgi:hypothetical protein